jgi:DNA-binding IclR family transcriptional regulator
MDPDRLRREIELTKRRGWADAPEEMFSGVNAIAAPIFSADGSLVGTLATVGAIHFIASPAPADTVHALCSAARRISQALGYAEPSSPEP